VKIEAYNGAGDVLGPEIREPILSGPAALLARAAAELSAARALFETIDLQIPFQEGLQLGQRLLVSEDDRPAWIGRVIGISTAADGSTLTQTLTLERPASCFNPRP
jgi:hypothetical protein